MAAEIRPSILDRRWITFVVCALFISNSKTTTLIIKNRTRKFIFDPSTQLDRISNDNSFGTSEHHARFTTDSVPFFPVCFRLSPLNDN